MDAIRTFRSRQGTCALGIVRSRSLVLLAMAVLALAACATHPKPQSTPPPPLHARPARSVPAAPRMPVRAQPSGESLAPADVGYYMDVMQGRIKQAMGNVGVSRQGDRIALDLTGRIVFGPGSAQLGNGNHALLEQLSKALVEYRMTLVSVRVRADDPATHAIDPRLSAQRAQAIASELAAAGVGLKRIVIAGVGADKRAHVELLLEPIVSPAGNGH